MKKNNKSSSLLLTSADNYNIMTSMITRNKDKTMKATINKSTKNVKRITKVQFGWIVEIVRAGEIVRRFECATMKEARRCE